MKIAIATDTNSSMTQKQADEHGIYLLPMPVIIDGETYLEGLNIDNAQLYNAMKEHRDISSSQPSPGQLIEFWENILKTGYDQIVYIPMSSGLSNSCHNAIQFSRDYDGKIQVVDNHRISLTQEASVLSALLLAQQGLTAEEIKNYLEERAYQASIYITVDSMEYLKKRWKGYPGGGGFCKRFKLKTNFDHSGG